MNVSHQKFKNSQKKELILKLEIYYGCKLEELQKYNFYINQRNKKVYILSCNLDNLNLQRISGYGLYFGTFHDDDRFRLSIEGSHFVKPQKNFIEINDEKLSSYISGETLFKDEVKKYDHLDRCPFLIVRHKDESIGCVSPKQNELLNYIPKSRRLHFNKLY